MEIYPSRGARPIQRYTRRCRSSKPWPLEQLLDAVGQDTLPSKCGRTSERTLSWLSLGTYGEPATLHQWGQPVLHRTVDGRCHPFGGADPPNGWPPRHPLRCGWEDRLPDWSTTGGVQEGGPASLPHQASVAPGHYPMRHGHPTQPQHGKITLPGRYDLAGLLLPPLSRGPPAKAQRPFECATQTCARAQHDSGSGWRRPQSYSVGQPRQQR